MNGAKVEELDPELTTGTFTLEVIADAQMELRAYNEVDAVATSEAEVVVASPEALSFTSDGPVIWLGERITLSWESQGGREIQITAEGVEEPICESRVYAEVDAFSCDWQPSAPGSYLITLSVSNGSGISTRTLELDVGTGARIVEFTMDPPQLSHGESATARWAVLPDPAGTLPSLLLSDGRGGSHSLSEDEGSLTFPIESGEGEYEFTLTATTSHEHSEPTLATAKIFVHGLPTATLHATLSLFDERHGEDVVLEWTSTFAADLALVQLTHGEALPILSIPEEDRAAGSHRVVPADDATYQLIATNPLGRTATATAEVTLADPEVLTFSADLTEIVAGQPVLLSWTTNMASEVSLDILQNEYIAEETSSPFIDITELDDVRLPLTNECTYAPVLTQGCAALTFPNNFLFPFDGVNRTEVRIYNTGFLSFDAPNQGLNTTLNQQFPTIAAYDLVHIAPFWDALVWNEERYPEGNISYLLREGPSRSLIVQWTDVSIASYEEVSLTFQVILWENGEFEFRYQDMSASPDADDVQRGMANGNGASIGFQNPSKSEFDTRCFDQVVVTPGSLSGRTFAYRKPPALERNGSYLWHPYAGGSEIKATLTASRGGKTDQADVTITVHQKPDIHLSILPSAPIEVGEEFRIGWKTARASSLEIIDPQGVTRCVADGQLAIAESFCTLEEEEEGRYVYRVRATGHDGFLVERMVEAIVYEPFGIEDFDADRLFVDPDGSVTLAWSTYGGESLSLTANGDDVPLPSDVEVGADSITLSQLGRNTTFVLRLTNRVGMSVEKTLLVEVWAVRLEVTADKSEVRPGELVTLTVDASDLGGGADPTIWGTFPMADISEGFVYSDISGSPGAEELEMSNVTFGFADVELPFDFHYFGETHRALRVFVEGYVSFTPGATSFPTNRLLPDGSTVPLQNVHIAPFWDDFTMQSASSVWTSSPDPDTFVVQWKSSNLVAGSNADRPYDLNFQIAFFRGGAFEFRYGTMTPPPGTSVLCHPETCVNEANGSSATIGYQMPGGRAGYTLHFGGSNSALTNPPFPGGLANRAFRYQPITRGGQVQVHPRRTDEYAFCTLSGPETVCRWVEVEAPFGVDFVRGTTDSIAFGAPFTIEWETFGGTELRIVDLDGKVVLETSNLGLIDKGSVVDNPVKNQIYTVELTAHGNRWVSTVEVEVVRAIVTAAASPEAFPGRPFTLSWNLSVSDPNLQPVIVRPLEEVQGAAFSALDISRDPDAILIHGANVATAVHEFAFDPDFTFNYLGVEMTGVKVASTGYLSFSDSMVGSAANSALPSASSPAHIAPFWEALNTRTNGRVLAKRVSEDTYVFQWSRVSVSTGSSAVNEYDLNFMAVLNRDGSFEFRYGLMLQPPTPSPLCQPNSCENEANGSSATIGYQSPTGTAGFHLHFESASNTLRPVPGGLSDRSWRFTPVSASGSMQVPAWNDTNYQICAIAPEGDAFCSEILSVKVEWGVSAFDVTPWAVMRGDSVTLSWEAVNMDQLIVKANGVELVNYVDPAIPSQSSIVHTPTENTEYELVATSVGRVVHLVRTVEIRALDIELTSPPGRHFPGDMATISWNVTQHEPGLIAVASPMQELPAGPGEPGAYEDVSLLPGAMKLSISNPAASVNLPFPFPFFGTLATELLVYIDGYLSFDMNPVASPKVNDPLPGRFEAQQRIHIAPFWDDLEMHSVESVWTAQTGPDTFVIQWKNFSRYAGSGLGVHYDLNFQVVLHSDGTFDFRYGRMAPPPQPFSHTGCYPNTCEREAQGSSATIGYQSIGGRFGSTLHYGGNGMTTVADFPGGLANRAFRFESSPVGSAQVKVNESEEHTVCAFVNDFMDCATIAIHPVAHPGDILITELMIDPAHADEQWLEVRNLTDEVIDLDGFEIRNTTGSHTIRGRTEILPYGFAVLAASTVPGHTPAAVYGSSVRLDPKVDTLVLRAGTADIATVHWDGTWQIPSGRSLSLDPGAQLTGHASFDSFDKWCDAGSGNPGALGAGCMNDFYDLEPNASGGFIDISAIGTPVLTSAETWLVEIPLPGFDLSFFGSPVEMIWASSNGWLSFSEVTPTSGNTSPTSLPRAPAAHPAGPLLAAFMDTLRCRTDALDCAFLHYYGEVGGQDVLSIQWDRFRRITPVGTITFQVQLWENGDIHIVFDEISPEFSRLAPETDLYYHGAMAWIGLESSDRTNHLTALHRKAVDLRHRAFHFKRR